MSMNLGLGIGLGFGGGRAYAVPSLPTFRDVQPNLATYAAGYTMLADMESVGDWTVPASSGLAVTTEEQDGFRSLKVVATDSTAYDIKMNYGGSVPFRRHLVFRQFIDDADAIFNNILRGWTSDGSLAFSLNLTGTNAGGVNPNAMPTTGENWWIVDMDDVGYVGSYTSADVHQIGLRVACRGLFDSLTIWTGPIETVDFRPMVTIRFDDTRQSQYTRAFPLTEARGLDAIISVITGNPDLENLSTSYGGPWMTKAQIEAVRDAGWDLCNHTRTHPNLSTLTDAAARAEIVGAATYLRDHLNAGDPGYFVITPFGGYDAENLTVARDIASGVMSQNGSAWNECVIRNVADGGSYNFGNHWYNIRSSVGDNKTAAQLQAYVDDAIANQEWRVILFHDVADTGGSLAVAETEFEAFLDYLVTQSAAVDVVTISDAVARMRGEA